jgi:type I restriction enzyme, R subunit
VSQVPPDMFPHVQAPTIGGEFGEAPLVEAPAIALIEGMNWAVKNLYHEWAGGETDHEVILTRRLRLALARLNPALAPAALDQAIEELTRDRSKLVPINANEEFYRLLKDGAPVKVPDEHGTDTIERVRFIDWRSPENNDFLLASQFWVSGDVYKRRCDMVGFVNGIPLVLFELKAPHKQLKSAYDDNLADYRYAIPQLFVPNAFVVLSNGTNTVVGGSFSEWQEFFEWKRVNDEGEKGAVSLDTAIRGTCTRPRLLDIVENFIVYEAGRGGVVKKLAKNHQYLGVNRAIEEVKNLGKNQGRLGVFWHTQGSGKSLSMVYFSQKILRTLPGNWTFVIVTDRDELDGQIYKTFAATGAVTEAEGSTHAATGKHLQQLLKEDHRYVFTLIHKFQTETGEQYPVLSERSDIIVITDEAHRSQYDTLALNMRNALPNAAFIGFTGTPLMAGEEKTREVFGDYVSVYNFAQSIEDGATVPLYYENRIPELQLTNVNLRDDMERLLEDAELDEAQEGRVEKEFAREYHLITRDDRLEKVAEDIVQHFMGRGHRGKAMVICIDKATAVRMFDKVKVHWNQHLDNLKDELTRVAPEQRDVVAAKIAEMEAMDMAVVVSQGQNEVAELAKKGLDIRPHRKRMIDENLDEKFKDPNDPLRLVFVCAMWITGFDVPSCSTIYLDKPMKNHTLMQTIARANRNFPGKEAGLIVDYVGVFRNLQQALAIYGGPRDGEPGDTPIKDKAALVEHLKYMIAEGLAFCSLHGVDAEAIKAAKGFDRVGALDDAVEALIATDDTKKAFLNIAITVARVYRAVLPDPVATQVAPDAVLLSVLAAKIRALTPRPDIAHVMGQVEELLDRSVAAEAYVMPTGGEEQPLVDLSKIDFEALKERFASTHKRTEAEKLQALIAQRLQSMVSKNPSRADFLERFQRLIDAYNAGSQNIEAFFAELIKLAQSLNEEERRSIREGLTEEELALFDILTKPEPDLTEKEKAEVKKVCKALLETLKAEKLVLDWRNKPQARAAVRQAIEVALDKLPAEYDEAIYARKCDAAYRHVYDCYYGGGESLYSPAEQSSVRPAV